MTDVSCNTWMVLKLHQISTRLETLWETDGLKIAGFCALKWLGTVSDAEPQSESQTWADVCIGSALLSRFSPVDSWSDEIWPAWNLCQKMKYDFCLKCEEIPTVFRLKLPLHPLLLLFSPDLCCTLTFSDILLTISFDFLCQVTYTGEGHSQSHLNKYL